MTHLVRQLRGGQITIPADIRKELGLEEDSLLHVTAEKGELRIRPVRVTGQQGSPWVRELYELFAPVREDLKHLSEAEINDPIDKAVQAVRQEAQHE
jgi:AbrB family looped-hinge helix DNA binding protein